MSTASTTVSGSRRPDGTLRKEIRVRAGFRSEENTAAFKSRGTLAREQSNGLPPGMSASAQAKTAPSKVGSQSQYAAPASVAANSTSKTANTRAVADIAKAPVGTGTASVCTSALASSPPEDEAFKELRKLKKKLRRIEEQEAVGVLTAEQSIAKAALLNEIELLEK